MRLFLCSLVVMLMATASADAAIVGKTKHSDATFAVPGDVVNSIVSGDMLEQVGVVASESNAATGWHGAAPAEPGRFIQVTDGAGPATNLDGLMNDFSGAPVNVFTYALTKPKNVSAVQVIGGNYGGDGRAFITVVVEASTDGGNNYFGVGGVGGTGYYQSDPSGTLNQPPDGFEETRIRIKDDGGADIVSGATHLRFSMFSVDNTGGQNRDPYDGVNPYTNLDDGLTAAFVSPLIWEIDALPEPSSAVLLALGALIPWCRRGRR